MSERQLRRLKVHNYKNIKADSPLELQNLNVMIGPNGSGKTTLIKLLKRRRLLLPGLQKNKSRSIRVRADMFIYPQHFF